ncbi:hypothetical protein HK097_001775 [Rhizophlyctis rosea]|uniref:Centromere protein J C-terminal domain-containing protein n=1 Tax=Rhizophlyctis rosea TaxID=64517 RepID=A0AAD5S423_9FUNG|nr:hypothetical protein HK097_001775 [Rhizophlyctis rosea]
MLSSSTRYDSILSEINRPFSSSFSLPSRNNEASREFGVSPTTPLRSDSHSSQIGRSPPSQDSASKANRLRLPTFDELIASRSKAAPLESTRFDNILDSQSDTSVDEAREAIPATSEDEDDLALERELLTPARLANREQWEQKRKLEADELREFQELEKRYLYSFEEDHEHESFVDAEENLDVVFSHPHEVDESPLRSGAKPRTVLKTILDDSLLISDESITSSLHDEPSPLRSSKRNLSILFLEREEQGRDLEKPSSVTINASRPEAEPTRTSPPRAVTTHAAEFSNHLLHEDRAFDNQAFETTGATDRTFNESQVQVPLGVVQSADTPQDMEADSYEELRNKLAALEEEVARYRQSDSLTRRLKDENERAMQKLLADKIAFENYKNAEMKKVQDFREEETRNLKREKQNWEKQRKAAEILPTKRERQEMDLLRKEMADLQETFRQKEMRMTLAQDRLKRRVDELTKRNAELQGEVKFLEQERAAFVERNEHASTLPRQGSNPMVVNHAKVVEERHAKGANATVEAMTQRSPPVAVVKPVATISRESVPQYGKVELDAVQAQLGMEEQFEETVTEGKRERHFESGLRLVWYANGTIKEAHVDGNSMIYFTNGDYKKVTPDGRTIYWYAEPKTMHTTFKDGLQLYEFDNGQVEKHYPDGTNEITFSDGTVKYSFPNGEEESIFPDGRIQRRDEQGVRTLEHPDGSREVVFANGVKQKSYSDGTVRTQFEDGRLETRYKDGRCRVKDAQGNLILDTRSA